MFIKNYVLHSIKPAFWKRNSLFQFSCKDEHIQVGYWVLSISAFSVSILGRESSLRLPFHLENVINKSSALSSACCLRMCTQKMRKAKIYLLRIGPQCRLAHFLKYPQISRKTRCLGLLEEMRLSPVST